MKTIRIIIILFLVTFYSKDVFAVSLSEALLQAYKNNPELNAERENIEVSKQDLKISKTILLFIVPPYCGCGCNIKAIGAVFLSFLKYFASILPAGPGINNSLTLLTIGNIDYYYQKKTRFYNMSVRLKRNFFFSCFSAPLIIFLINTMVI